MNNIITMLMNAAMTTAGFVGFKLITSRRKRNYRCHKLASKKVKNALCRNIDTEYTNLYNPYWKKIGIISNLLIYPVKSSEMSVFYQSFEFRDYGMCKREFQTFFWDGMFLVYNKTKDRFEDSRRYPFLTTLRALLTNIGQVTLSSDATYESVELDINQCLTFSNRFVRETWNGTFEIFYASNPHVNIWLKELIDVNEINEDLILALMCQRDWDSTEKIKNNWYCFLRGYDNMEEDETGKFISLPRFVLMTVQTAVALSGKISTPNIIVKTDDESIKPFEEKNWDWVKIGNDVTLRKIKPVPSFNEDIEHYGIYYALWSGGNVKIGDETFVNAQIKSKFSKRLSQQSKIAAR